MNNLIEINNLKKKFHLLNDNHLLIFENLNFSITKNSITSIVGSSGCGKSTFLNILGLLDSNFEGQFLFESKATKTISSNQLSNIRNKKIGFIHQFFNLIPELSVLENVILPGLISKNKEEVVSKEACELLDIFGILDKKNIKPNKLSGGEQQRVASARALINKPDLILADEMTGNLDEDTSDEIVNFFLKFIKSNNTSLLYVTHNQKYADMANNKYEFKNKKLILK
ncbi:ABC transporter ATP-binding protein [Alphaproteobacteria bacterium]|nr:ABC transporter ATP-binding protein [Alphaproteobacteria bacterium]